MMAFSHAAHRNRDPILAQLKKYNLSGTLLEVASGSGQHGVHMQKNIPALEWQSSERAEVVPSLREGMIAEKMLFPLTLEIGSNWWLNIGKYSHLYTANSLHIMSWDECQLFLGNLGRVLEEKGLFFVYGPFKFSGKFTSLSNRDFDRALKERDSRSGIRDFEEVCALLERQQLVSVETVEMPANNFLLVFSRSNHP